MEVSSGGRLHVDEPAPYVTRLTLDNPDKRNALDHALLDAIATTLQGLSGETRCVLLAGAGPVFSAGYDIGAIDSADFERRAESLIAHPFTAALDAIAAFDGPTLAALNGHAIGGGLELALACDLRIASAEALMGMPPALLGLVYSHTGVRRFIDAVGAPRTRELFLLARNIDAQTALQWGLVNRVSTPDRLMDDAVAMAAELASRAPLSQRGNKRVIDALLDERGALAEDVEEELLALRRASFASSDMREGIAAFVEKRAPRWRGE